MTRRTLNVMTIAAVCVIGTTHPAAQQDPSVGVLHVQGNVHVLVTSAGNVTAQIGPDGVLVVDAGTASTSGSIVAAVRRLTDQPIRWIVNTHAHPDHTGGNEAISRAGRATPMGAASVQRLGTLPTRATIVAHELVLNRMRIAPAGQASSVPFDAWPGDTYFGVGVEKEMYLNGEPIRVIHQPRAHTDGDSIVFFRHSDVISAGDVFDTTSYPVIDVEAGGTINGVIAALNRVIEIAIPKEKQEGGTYVIPGHGRVADEADVVTYRNMAVVIRDRVLDMRKRGMTLEQVKAARPTAEYDRRWTTPGRTAEMFVETVYRTLPPATSTAQR